MKTFLLLCVAVLPGASVFAQGSLTPPGAPAPTMKTLAQIEPRTPISSAPFTITTPGSYYLTTNLTVSGGDAITIAANGVTLDLNGFTIASTAASAAGYGILINSGLRDLAILNGFIQGGVTANVNGVYSGSGFGDGIHGYPVQNARVSGVSVSGCLYFGIHLGAGDSTVAESCTVRTVGSIGIVASTIKASVAMDCGGYAISGSQVADCRGESTGSSYGVIATTAQNCYGVSGGSGYGLYANTALNCYGNSSSGYGLYANTAQNCSGSSSSGTGLQAYTAYNCVGLSSGSGYGVIADQVAIGCYGNSVSGDGVHAFIVNNCYGSSSSGFGVYAYDIAIGSYGVSSSGTGLRAFIANSCDGNTTNIVNKYNMP
jgi:hypothetical protein